MTAPEGLNRRAGASVPLACACARPSGPRRQERTRRQPPGGSAAPPRRCRHRCRGPTLAKSTSQPPSGSLLGSYWEHGGVAIRFQMNNFARLTINPPINTNSKPVNPNITPFPDESFSVSYVGAHDARPLNCRADAHLFATCVSRCDGAWMILRGTSFINDIVQITSRWA